jgi:hypothetical protein
VRPRTVTTDNSLAGDHGKWKDDNHGNTTFNNFYTVASTKARRLSVDLMAEKVKEIIVLGAGKRLYDHVCKINSI